MKTPLLAMLALTVALTACGRVRESRLNPFNWFGKDREEVATLAPTGGYAAALADDRPMVAQVTRLEIKQTPTGAIVSATGLPPTQGLWDAELVALNGGEPDENGVLTYAFKVYPPFEGTPPATRVMGPQSREVTAAAFLNTYNLQRIRKVVVEAQGNARSVSR